uniref:Protein JASON n=1 Tax=Leersia perrieri TaxID=77586 RepID=A0A0D9VZP3_9ORYZ
MMGWLFGCFRLPGGGGEGRRGRERADQQLVSTSSVSVTSPVADSSKVGERKRPPSKNALSAVFLREDEGSRVGQTASSGMNGIAERTKVGEELKIETCLLKNNDALLEAPNEIRQVPENTYQSQPGLACLPAISDEQQFVVGLKVEDCQTPSISHKSSTSPDAMSSSWKGHDASSQIDSDAVSKNIDVEVVDNGDSVINSGKKLTALDSSSFTCKDDISSPISTPSEATAGIQTPATTHVPNLEELRDQNNTRTSSEHAYEAPNSVEAVETCEKSRKESCQPDISDEDFKCANNGNSVSIELSISNECSLFQSSEGSVSSCNKRRDNSSTYSVDKCLKSDPTVHSSKKKVLRDNGSEVEFPSLSQWLKPPNPKKPFRDVPFTSDRSHSAKSSEEDRPIIGLVAAHWSDKEPDNFTSKWWDGNGIPNSTNKYKEDQKVSWHATPFEERLEKALSDEKLLSQRSCSSGNPSQLSGLEGEENDTAASNSSYLYVAAS